MFIEVFICMGFGLSIALGYLIYRKGLVDGGKIARGEKLPPDVPIFGVLEDFFKDRKIRERLKEIERERIETEKFLNYDGEERN